MGQPTCTFCSRPPDGSVKDVLCCRSCACKTVPVLVARAFIGQAQAVDLAPCLDALLRDFGRAFWQEVAVVVQEQQASRRQEQNDQAVLS